MALSDFGELVSGLGLTPGSGPIFQDRPGGFNRDRFNRPVDPTTGLPFPPPAGAQPGVVIPGDPIFDPTFGLTPEQMAKRMMRHLNLKKLALAKTAR